MTNLNKIMPIMHLKESIMKIIMKFTNFNEVNENYGQIWNFQQVLKNNWKYTLWISAFLKENFFSDASILVVWDRNKIENYLEFDVVELIINQCLSLGTSLFSYANRVVVLNANDDYQV